ncbi:MAG: (2Fe-2S)-binding protein [Gammaproteobacteria bacterium]|nr:(2Fe-2S)-binding protein [Gammaproteobacteria bacterium]MDE2273246.1 (2Fe-2S)-binding protein [Gammaproteobacteria bacterium]
MIVCVCNAVTESQIRLAIDEGALTVADLRARLAVTSECGCCAAQVDEALARRLLEIAGARASGPSAGSLLATR